MEEPQETLEREADFIGGSAVADRRDPEPFHLLDCHTWNRKFLHPLTSRGDRFHCDIEGWPFRTYRMYSLFLCKKRNGPERDLRKPFLRPASPVHLTEGISVAPSTIMMKPTTNSNGRLKLSKNNVFPVTILATLSAIMSAPSTMTIRAAPNRATSAPVANLCLDIAARFAAYPAPPNDVRNHRAERRAAEASVPSMDSTYPATHDGLPDGVLTEGVNFPVRPASVV